MSIELLLIIYTILYWTAVSIAYWAGWRARDRQRPLRGAAQVRSYGAQRRRGPQFNEGRTIRGNGNGGPTTPKPEFPPGRVTDVHGTTIGYRSINYPDPSPDRRPTNPFNGERIPNQPPRNP